MSGISLKRRELVVGGLYRCCISGRVVLVVSKEGGVDESVSGGKDYSLVMGRYFNEVSGLYEQINIIDGQLTKI